MLLEIPQQVPQQVPQHFLGMEPQFHHEQVVPERQSQNNNPHLQVGMTLVPEGQWDLIFREKKAKKQEKAVHWSWESSNLQGNPDNILVSIPATWVHFFNSMLLSADTFEWAKEFLTSRGHNFSGRQYW